MERWWAETEGNGGQIQGDMASRHMRKWWALPEKMVGRYRRKWWADT